ncbi:MAG: hypothetical protein JWQ35_282 [Bacteriovoracaceae bacterium]|nr:hypothetical protein [Bacteriovoracaceae bacterium]
MRRIAFHFLISSTIIFVSQTNSQFSLAAERSSSLFKKPTTICVVYLIAISFGIYVYGAHVLNLAGNAFEQEQTTMKMVENARTNQLASSELLNLISSIDEHFKKSVKQGPDVNRFGHPVFHGYDEVEVKLRRQKTIELKDYVKSHSMTAEDIRITHNYVSFLMQIYDVARKFRWDIKDRFISGTKFYSPKYFDPKVYSEILQDLGHPP